MTLSKHKLAFKACVNVQIHDGCTADKISGLQSMCGPAAGANVIQQQHLFNVYIHVGANEANFTGSLHRMPDTLQSLAGHHLIAPCACKCGLAWIQATRALPSWDVTSMRMLQNSKPECYPVMHISALERLLLLCRLP